MKLYFYKIKVFAFLSFLLFLFCFIPYNSFAQSVSLEVSQNRIEVGGRATIRFYINTGNNQVNTVGAKISIPQTHISFTDVRSGESIISLWAEKPAFSASSGVLSLSGGLPGGFSGSRGLIVSFGVKGLSPGTSKISFSEIVLLLNDGLGTTLPVTPASVTFEVVPASIKTPETPGVIEEPKKENVAVEVSKDIVPPEQFVPIVSRHPDIFDNEYFISFNAVDKDSGISHYEIEEVPFLLSLFSSVNSARIEAPPHVLSWQTWRTKVIIRAFDNEGNMTEVKVVKPFRSFVVVIFSILFGILITLLVLYFLGFLRKK